MRHRSGDFEGCAALCRFVLCADPGHADFWLLSGTAPPSASNITTRHRMLARALRLRPDDSNAALAFAQLAAGAGDFGLSTTLQRHTLALDPAHLDALVHYSETLRLVRRHDTGIQACRRAIALSPSRPELHVILGRHLSQIGDTAGAEEAFRAGADLCPDWGLPRLHHWRLMIDAGRTEEAREFGQRLVSDCPQYAEEVLSSIALDQARRDQWADALATYRRLAAIAPEIRAMLGDALSDGRDAGTCAAAFDTRGDGATDALPPMAGRFAAAYDAQGWQGRRILVLMPKHIDCDPQFIQHDLSHYLLEAASASGLEALFLPSDAVSYPMFMTPEKRDQSPSNLSAIAARIREFRPDIVAIDCNAYSDRDTINGSWLHALQADVPFKVVGLLPDNYGFAGQLIEHWLPTLDALVHFEPSSAGGSGPGGDKSILSYVPVPEYFDSDNTERDMAGIFVGSASNGALAHRALWLSSLMTHLPGCQVILGKRVTGAAPDFEEYAKLHGRAKISFNFGRRASGQMIVTGRAYESIKAGCLLLEQAGSRLGDFLVEGTHFMTFRNADEMLALSRHFADDTTARTRIATEARAFMRKHYSSKFFWPYVISHLDARQATV